MKTAFLKSPIGVLEITGNEKGISAVQFTEETNIPSILIPNCLQDCVTQLNAYFAGERNQFSVTLQPQGTEFQKQVWQSIQEIPFGNTRSYKEQSHALKNPKAIRAIANANGKNPILILIPCHRIIGSEGNLTGYAGGLARKKWLLNFEAKNKQLDLFPANNTTT